MAHYLKMAPNLKLTDVLWQVESVKYHLILGLIILHLRSLRLLTYMLNMFLKWMGLNQEWYRLWEI